MDGPPPPPKAPYPRTISEGLTIVNPLSRRDNGPGLVILVNKLSAGAAIRNGVPSPLRKWAEEGFCVVEVTSSAMFKADETMSVAIEALRRDELCQPKGVVGVVAYDAVLWKAVAPYIKDYAQIVGAVVYTSDLEEVSRDTGLPTLVHVAGKAARKLECSAARTEYDYPAQTAALFASPFTSQFDYATEAVSHTRNLTHLKRQMNGPYFDLEALWDEHTYYEFEVREVENTMNTMVQEPYVNHVPTLTGGIGREELTVFYRDHFVFSNPKDTELELISRTVGIDRVVDEFIFKFTHDKVIDWLLPGVPPTYKYVEIPFMAVVNIRGDRLYHEHISWDHATTLRQVGCLPETVPFSGAIRGVNGANRIDKQVKSEVRLPVAGNEGAAKLRDKNSVKSNEMFHL